MQDKLHTCIKYKIIYFSIHTNLNKIKYYDLNIDQLYLFNEHVHSIFLKEYFRTFEMLYMNTHRLFMGGGFKKGTQILALATQNRKVSVD